MSSPIIRHYAEVMDERALMLTQLATVLAAVRSEHALIGGIAAGYHGRQRATIDVDLLVPRRQLDGIAVELERLGYVIYRSPDQLRVYPPGANPDHDEAVADLVAMEADAVLAAAFDDTEPAIVLGQPIKVVRRGAFVALKFHAAISRLRGRADRMQDIVDIERVLARKFDDDDEAQAREIARLSYPGAELEFDRLIGDLRAGRPITI